jgi:hypothetical protein
MTSAVPEPNPGSRARTWVAAVADLTVVVVFVLIGRRTHHEDAGIAGFLRVAWPFAAGLVVAWIVTGLHRAPLEWPRVVGAWLLTVVVGMTLRVAVQGHEFKLSFAIVATLFLGAGMLSWRAIVCPAITAARRRRGTATR